jgi:alpha-glucosidase/alpha-D-xyloside xylohydrolase
MYWEGPQLYRPNQRPFALHRNASPGIQRFGGFIWSGDVRSRWETLRTHVAVGINTALSGFPYWGTDIGGFNPTPEYTGELHVRWFQFGAFCGSFRAHGRNWHLKLPWGWNGGAGGPFEAGQWRADPAELQNPQVEPICRKYLELRSRLMPYLYTAAREAHDTGMPIMRALWLQHPDDRAAVVRGDQYLWGPDLLVAPVLEKAPPAGACICRAAPGTISGLTSGWKAAVKSTGASTWPPCRSTCGQVRCCRLGRSSSTRMNRARNRSRS